MNKNRTILAILFFLALYLAVPIEMTVSAAELKTLIYDEAGLLDQEEYDELNLMANEYGAEREIDIIILTSNNDDNIDVMKMAQDFYDEQAPGYDKPHGDAVILTMEMRNRGIYFAGFYKGKEYLDDGRLDQIRLKIVPDLINGYYGLAFQKYIQTVHEYMGIEPTVNSGTNSGANLGISSGVNSNTNSGNNSSIYSNDTSNRNSNVDPDNILFNGWFQLAVSLGLGGLIVGMMAYRSGGRVTVNRHTYEDASTSGILDRRDQYLRTTTTKRKIEKNNGGGSGGGGGGTTGGGHSHSGSRGSF
ncbi:TPM domain-containing protein [Paenibacillus sp. FA6]|uniref:TPM domain-containing protein n=1 Tax=Paenibacillus sp. FA6 TaxID=3413029 RepID=UPI003F656EF9